MEKTVVFPDKTVAFSGFFGSAVVGRTVDLETLVDFDRLLRIAKVSYSRIQYLGGLSILISFFDEPSAKGFLEAKELWGPWCSKLEPWNGQSLALERVAWLRLHGIPLHLLDPEILSLVGDLFGKVLHTPKFLDEDNDLSFVRIGVLAGEAQRIHETVTVKWKNKSFRVGLEEEQDVWTPDCVGASLVCGSGGSSSSLKSSPVIKEDIGDQPVTRVVIIRLMLISNYKFRYPFK
ncbi:hypothetical protein Hdeb2414_s0003g00104501 [Helianthus debilis subsp. tardiflorus]